MIGGRETLKALFASGARVRVLEMFLLNPAARYYQRQVAEVTGLVIGSVQQEMPRLLRAGILVREEDGNRVYYRANARCPIFPELKAIFLKTSGMGDLLRQAFKKDRGAIQVAFIYGSTAKGEEEAWSDIDLFVVGEIGARALRDIVSRAEETLGREVNERLFKAAELRRRVERKDHFVTAVLAERKIFVVGDEHDLAAALEK